MGTFLITDYKPGPKHHFTRAMLIIGVVLLCLFVTTAFTSNDLLLMILQTVAVTLYTTFMSGILMLKINKDDTQKILQFCRQMYDIEGFFHEKFQAIARKHIEIAHDRSRAVLKWIVNLLFYNVIVMIPFMATITFLLPDSMFPKYSLPLPFKIFFLDGRKTLWAYISTIVAQAIVSLQISMGAAILYSVILAFILHVFAYLDIVVDVIEMMNEDIKKRFIGLEQKPKGAKDEPTEELDMTFWIKTIVDMVSDVEDAMSSFANVFNGFFLMSELTAFAALIAFGMVFLVLKQQYSFGICITAVSILFYVLCYVNEKLLTKLAKIREDLYGIQWYTLKAKEIKLLRIPLNVKELGIGFNALGIHDLTLDRFGTVVKAAYSNCLILKDIVEKMV